MIKNILNTFILFLFTVFSKIALAHTEAGGSTPPSGTEAGGTSSSSSMNFETLNNPLEGGGIDSIPSLVQSLLEIVLSIGVPIIAIAIIYTGFKFIAAQGSSTKLKEAKDMLLYVIIGSGILLAAYVIAESIGATVNAIIG